MRMWRFMGCGDRAAAVEYYGRLIKLWKDAGPELQPIVRDVRER